MEAEAEVEARNDKPQYIKKWMKNEVCVIILLKLTNENKKNHIKVIYRKIKF